MELTIDTSEGFAAYIEEDWSLWASEGKGKVVGHGIYFPTLELDPSLEFWFE